MATRSGPLRSPQPKKKGPGRHQRGPTLYQRCIQKNGQNFQKPWSRGLPQALQHPALHPCPSQRQDTWSQKVWCRLWNPVSRMPCQVCRWNCPHTGDKDERPPKTEVSTNSCGRTWTSHQNGRCQSDSLWGQYVATQDPWVHRNQDPPPGHQPRPGIWAPLIYDKLLSCGMWPRRISLIRLDEVAVMVTQASNLATYLTLIRYLSNELSCLPSPITTSMLLRNIRQLFGLNIDDC